MADVILSLIHILGAFTRSDKNEIDATIEKVYKRFPRLKERQNQTAGTLKMCIRDSVNITL